MQGLLARTAAASATTSTSGLYGRWLDWRTGRSAGDFIAFDLAAGEVLRADTSSGVCFDATVDFSAAWVGGVGRAFEVTRPVIRIAPGRSDSARGRTFEENLSVTKVDQVVSVLTSNWEYDVVKERFLQSDVDVTMDGGTQGHGEAAEISLWYICDQGSKSVAVQEYLFRAQQDRDIVTINIDPNLVRDLAGFKTNIEVGDTIALTHTVLPSGDGRGVSQGFYRILSVAPNLDVPMSLTLRLQDVLPFKKASTNQAFLNDARILGSNLFAVDHGQMIGAAADLQESTSIDPVHGQY